jgi:hypothetical protein
MLGILLAKFWSHVDNDNECQIGRNSRQTLDDATMTIIVVNYVRHRTDKSLDLECRSRSFDFEIDETCDQITTHLS